MLKGRVEEFEQLINENRELKEQLRSLKWLIILILNAW